MENSLPEYRGPGVQFSVSAAPLCPGADIWKLCQYLGGCCASFDGCLVVLGRYIEGELEPIMVHLVTLDLKRAVVVSLAHQESLLVKVFFFLEIFWACWVTLLVLLLLRWVLSSSVLVPFPGKKSTWKLRVLGRVADILTAGGMDVGLAHLERGDISGAWRGS